MMPLQGVKEPSFVEVMNRMYMPVVYMNRAEVNKYVREEFQKVGEIVKILRAKEAKENKWEVGWAVHVHMDFHPFMEVWRSSRNIIRQSKI